MSHPPPFSSDGSRLMFTALPEAMERVLDRLRERGEPVAVVDLAQRLLSLESPPEVPLARRVVAVALGWSTSSLPDLLQAQQLRPAEEAAVASVPIDAADFAVVDLETTGLAVERCAILEIGAVRVSRLRRAGDFQTLIRPPQLVPRAIAELTGIDEAMLAEAPPPLRALRSFRRWLDRTPGAPFVAHNVRFDARFVERALADAGLPPYRVPALCTQRLARRLLPKLGRYDLDHLCAHFGIGNRARHRALGDAEATARAWIEMLQLARSEGRAKTLGDLLDLQRRAARKSAAPPLTRGRAERRDAERRPQSTRPPG